MSDNDPTLHVQVGSHRVEAHVHESRLPGSDVPVYLIDKPAYFDRDELYQVDGKDYEDNCERFVFFDRAVLESIRLLGSAPGRHPLQRLADRADSGLPQDALSPGPGAGRAWGRC